MKRFLFSFTVVTAAFAGATHAQTLASWLAERIDDAYVNSVLEDDDFRAALHTTAIELTEGYQVADLSECRLRALESIVATAIGRRHRETPPQKPQLPGELEALLPDVDVNRQARSGPPSGRRDATGLFVQALVLAIHAPEYEPVDAEAIRGQIDAIVQAKIEELEDRNPGVLDRPLRDKLTELWSLEYYIQMEDCYHSDLKVSLEREVFESVLDAVRKAAPSSLAEDSTFNMMRDQESYGYELAAAWIRGQYRSHRAVYPAYRERSLAVFGPVDHEEVYDRLEAAGLERRIDRHQIRFIDNEPAPR